MPQQKIIIVYKLRCLAYGTGHHGTNQIMMHQVRSVFAVWGSSTVFWCCPFVHRFQMVSMGRRRFGTDFQLMFRILKGLLFLGFVSVMTVLFVVCGLTVGDVFASILAFMPTGWAILLVSHLQPFSNIIIWNLYVLHVYSPKTWLTWFSLFILKIGQACRPLLRRVGFYDSIKELARAYDNVLGLIIFMPIVILSWFPFVSEFQTRLLFNQAFSRGLQISRILAGRKDNITSNWHFGFINWLFRYSTFKWRHFFFIFLSEARQ